MQRRFLDKAVSQTGLGQCIYPPDFKQKPKPISASDYLAIDYLI